jgi:hypothetical protein
VDEVVDPVFGWQCRDDGGESAGRAVGADAVGRRSVDEAAGERLAGGEQASECGRPVVLEDVRGVGAGGHEGVAGVGAAGGEVPVGALRRFPSGNPLKP